MKNQVKKSLSLIMAVLMLLSCWVWVAPEKASAGAPDNYDVTVEYNVYNGSSGNDNPDEMKVEAWYFPKNGTGAESATTVSKVWNSGFPGEGNSSSLTLNVPGGYPGRVYVECRNDGIAAFAVDVTAIKINGKTVWSGSSHFEKSATSKDLGMNWYPDTYYDASADPSGGAIDTNRTNGTWDWARPQLSTVVPTLEPDLISLNRINSGVESKTTVSLGGFVDSYGVNWTGPINPSFSLRADGVEINDSHAKIEVSGNTATVKVMPWFQTLFPGRQNAKLYVDWSTYGGKGGTQTINVDFPTYNAYFYGNGGTIGTTDSEALTEIMYEGEKMNIGSVIGVSPAYRTRDGFEFKGFYSEDYDDALGLTTNFDNSKKFEDRVTKFPAATSGNGDTKWYAAWQAAPLDITFISADNQRLATLTGRHNNYMIAGNMYGSRSNLNAKIASEYTGTAVKFNSNNEPIYKDGSTTYEFVGWRIVEAYDESVMDLDEKAVLKGNVTYKAVYKRADAATYTVSFKDAEGKVISSKNDYKFRDDVTLPDDKDLTLATDDTYSYEFIGWANDIGKNYYTVDANNKDKDGAVIPYVHKDAAEFTVKGDATYVPVFRMIYREYDVTYSYKEDGNKDATVVLGGHHWHDNPQKPEIKDNYTAGGLRHYLIGWRVGSATSGTIRQLNEIEVVNGMKLYAAYGNQETAEYTINFYGKAADGVTKVHLNPDNNIYKHSTTEAIVAPEVPQTIETEDSLFTFQRWNPAVRTYPTADSEHEAIYTRKDYADVYYYNYDGTLLKEFNGKENSLFANINRLPAYDEIPVKAEDVVGTYTFTGWADSNGNEYLPGRTQLTGDTYLYAQYKTEYKMYTVKFVNGDGTEIDTKKYKYGEEITVPADPTMEEDIEYIYDFRSWSPDISKVCYGDATYNAVYAKTPKYYTVTWLKDNKTILSESNYRYNAKIQQANFENPVSLGNASEGMTWSLKEWISCNASGQPINAAGDVVAEENAARFVRGQKMPAEHIYFYPVFEEVANILSVDFYREDGVSYLGTAKIPYGRNIADYADTFAAKALKISDDEYHYVIKEWVNIKNGLKEDVVKADLSVKATYTAEEHKKEIYELVSEPTCNVPGYAHYKCDVDECTDIDYNVAIAPIADEGAPTGKLYVGEANSWTLADYNAGIDYNDVRYVGPATNVIVTTEDTGTRSKPWNPEGELSRGVGTIAYYVSSNIISNPKTIPEKEWTVIYDVEAIRTEVLNEVLKQNKLTFMDYNSYTMGTAEQKVKKAAIDKEVENILAAYHANATDVLSNIDALVNGREYIIYMKVSDREGNGEVNTAYFSSGKLNYGTEAAKVVVTGNGYGTKFCAEATLTVTDDTEGFTVYVDGTEVTGLTLSDDGKKATFVNADEGLHTLTVVDKHGNKTTKIFEVKENHSFRNYSTSATCDTDGSRYDLCTLCGVKANETVIPKTGHKYVVNFIDKAADCLNNGYRTYVCENNCGTSIELYPTSDAAVIAQAKKVVDGVEVDLTAADLAHLKATGAHTYEKVKDEAGNDTAVDAWVIDKAATCKAEGSKHRDCTVCGIIGRETEVIPVDTVNGHKFYREKVTVEPGCINEGERSKTCRYCGTKVVVEVLPALGHTEGEYKDLVAATCEAAGSKILTCSVCKAEIGEPIKDADGKITGFDGNAVEIKALGHEWLLDGGIYQDTTDSKWYQNKVCKNDANHTMREEVEGYEPPVAAVATFMNGENDTAPVVVNKYVGETIVEANVAKPSKAADKTKRYIFSHWVDKTGAAVEFPIKVTGDATYYAVYTEKFVNYTITYYKDVEKTLSDGTTTIERQEYKKVGYLHNGDEVELIAGPVKAENSLVKYVFKGWKVTNGTEIYTDKVTIEAANINLVAEYDEVQKEYFVTYAYSSNDIIFTYTVPAGTTAPDARADGYEIEKESDTKYHYNFTSWNRAAQLAAVKSNIYTTPNFTPELHSFRAENGGSIVEKTPASCGVNRVDTYTCACGYTYDKEAPGTALEHNWGTPVYDEETGKNTITCDDCGATEIDTRSFNAKFYVDGNLKSTVSYIKWGSTLKATQIPTNTAKADDDMYTYAFKGWALKGDADENIIDFATYEIKNDCEFVAVYTKTLREYTVIFRYDGSDVVIESYKVKAGESVTYGGAKPTKSSDINYHYTFKNWQGYAAGAAGEEEKITITNIQQNLTIKAEFSKAKHNYAREVELNDATCQYGKGVRKYCECGAYEELTGKPLDHNYEIVDQQAATPNSNGFIKYECQNIVDGEKCGYVKEEILEYQDNTVEIKVYVKHNGVAESGVKVEIFDTINKKTAAVGTTNKNGYATFKLDEAGAYIAFVTDEKVQIELYKEGDGYVGNYSYDDPSVDCTCACHRDNVWGAIFRFFHKIIKLFTGEFKCCKNPDPMYG